MKRALCILIVLAMILYIVPVIAKEKTTNYSLLIDRTLLQKRLTNYTTDERAGTAPSHRWR
jgi:hypothetical protein